MTLKKGLYTTDNSDLLIEVKKVRYQTDEYAKISCTLSNKINGIVYVSYKNHKVFKKNIAHWKKVGEELSNS